MAEFTPMMQQYFKIKEQHRDEILFYRLGDFYEMFFDDAITVARELELVLTGRECGQPERAPMCGIPIHAVDTYVARLLARGYKVAVCEQMEDPATAKGLVKRDIVRVVTPGTVTESAMLDESRNNYLACVFYGDENAGLCFCDVSTGEVQVCAVTGIRRTEEVVNELIRFEPIEILLNPSAAADRALGEAIARKISATAETMPAENFLYESNRQLVEKHFEKAIEALSLGDMPDAVCALGETLRYLYATQRNGLSNITGVLVYAADKFMKLDAAARRNLELTQNERRREKKGSLLWVLDRTKTAMGKRLLRAWLEQPLVNIAGILYRQNAVEELVTNTRLRTEQLERLAGVNDLERVMTRIVYGSANARELCALSQTFALLPDIRSALDGAGCNMLRDIAASLDCMEDLRTQIEATLTEEPPFSVREGGMIRPGCSEELDELRAIEDGGSTYIEEIERREQERTGIKKLRVGYNRVFGYYIEVTNQYKDSVPDDYIRKQTLANAERFVTMELKELEAKVLNARERIAKLEYTLFTELRERAAAEQERIRGTAAAIARLDALCSLAAVAVENNYVRPVVNASDVIEIREGRHPVVEKFLDGAPFVPNDTYLDCGENRTAIITGPNMAGKSTYMRQIALLVLLAQTGSFAPAASATVGVVDGIYTRVGASDDLAAGQSTFMTEMSEVSSILASATGRSLVLLDEIGRGTSTFDGMSIARAVLEYVNDKRRIGCKTLFATHYHELTVMENELAGVRNYNTSVKKRGDAITFLRRIVRGGADGSYGIEVALLAGVPKSVVTRARVILRQLEAQGHTAPKPAFSVETAVEDSQLSMRTGINDAVLDELRGLDVDTLTPIEALTKLYELKKKAD